MPKFSKPVQGIIVVMVAVLVGLPIFLTVGSDKEGFLGLVVYEVEPNIGGPESTAEPGEDATVEPTESPNEAETPVATEEAVETVEPTETEEAAESAETEEPVATEEAVETEPSSTPAPAETEIPEATEEPIETAEPEATEEFPFGYEIDEGPLRDARLQVASDTIEIPTSRGADINLIFQWFMFFSLLFGASFAVRKDFVSHRNVMTFNVLVNWFSIAGRMLPKVGDWTAEANPTTYSKLPIQIHALGGGIVMIFASYLIFRMWFEKQLPSWIKIEPIKVWMRLTLVLWLSLILLGTFMYFDIHSN